MPFFSKPESHNGHNQRTSYQTDIEVNGNGTCETSAAHSDALMPIAVVGISCRMPGDATDPENLWKMISEGRSAWSEVPPDRFNVNAFHHPSGDRQGTVSLFS